MSKDQKHHWIVEHIWRGLRAVVLIAATAVWLYTEQTHTVLVLIVIAAVIDQLHGLICRAIQRAFNWKVDFNEWE